MQNTNLKTNSIKNLINKCSPMLATYYINKHKNTNEKNKNLINFLLFARQDKSIINFLKKLDIQFKNSFLFTNFEDAIKNLFNDNQYSLFIQPIKKDRIEEIGINRYKINLIYDRNADIIKSIYHPKINLIKNFVINNSFNIIFDAENNTNLEELEYDKNKISVLKLTELGIPMCANIYSRIELVIYSTDILDLNEFKLISYILDNSEESFILKQEPFQLNFQKGRLQHFHNGLSAPFFINLYDEYKNKTLDEKFIKLIEDIEIESDNRKKIDN
jgi:hypothetical protein